jgi:type II secretory pathway component PulF
MTLFRYRALGLDSAVATGQLEAGGRLEAMAQLEARGLRPLELVELEAAALKDAEPRHPWTSRRVSAREVEAFTRQLASLLAAGLPLAQALSLLTREAVHAPARQTWQAVHDDVVEGCSLAQAMANRNGVFAQVHVAMVRAGETGGFLSVVLRQIADFQSRDRDLRSRVHGALIYPAVLACLAVAVLVFLMVFFIPRFQGIFADFGGNLPALTTAIVNTSLLFQHYGLVIVLAVVIVTILLRRHFRTEQGRLWLEQQTLRLPLFGTVASHFAMTRFCRMLGTLTNGGVPLITALRVARESLGNQTLADAVDTAITRVQHGEELGASLGLCSRLFSSSTVAMVTVAEQSGRLAEELIRIADDAEQDLDRGLRAAVSLAEPAMLAVMAALIGTIVVGMVLPIFAIQDLVK